MYSVSTEYPGNRESMNIYLGETRLATRLAYEHDETTAYEQINTYYYHGDHLGSANIVSDFEGGKYEHLEYTPYGELWVEDTDAAYHTPFRFTSKEWDEETELYYYGARYMHPRNSTWISADPAGFELVNPMEQDENGKLVAKQSYSLIEGVNWYSYCSNNPVKYVDPDGKMAQTALLPLGPVGWIATGVITLAIIYATSQTDSKATANVISRTKTNDRTAPVIRMQVQNCTKGSSKETLATTAGVMGVPEVGVTKGQALVALNTLKNQLPKGMRKSKEFKTALAKLQEKIVSSAGIPDGNNVYQTKFTYKGTEYRIDLDSYGGKGRNLSE